MAHFAAFRTASLKLRAVFNLAPQNTSHQQHFDQQLHEHEHGQVKKTTGKWKLVSGGQRAAESSAEHAQEGSGTSSSCASDAAAAPYVDPATYGDSDELPTLANSTIDRCNRILQQNMDRWERAAVVHSGSPIDAGDDFYEGSSNYTRQKISIPGQKKSTKRAETATLASETIATSSPQTTTTPEKATALSSPTRHGHDVSKPVLSVAQTCVYAANKCTTVTNFAKTIPIELMQSAAPPTSRAGYTAIVASASEQSHSEMHHTTSSVTSTIGYTAIVASSGEQGSNVTTTETYEDAQCENDTTVQTTSEQFVEVTKKKRNNTKQKDMGEISDRVRKELISPQKIVSAKIVKFSKNGFPVVRFTGQFTWIGLRAKVEGDSQSSFENYKVGQNVNVQITNIYQESESDSESYWLVDCKLREDHVGQANESQNLQKRSSEDNRELEKDSDQHIEPPQQSTMKFGPKSASNTMRASSQVQSSRANLNPSASSFVPSGPSMEQPGYSYYPQAQHAPQQSPCIGAPYYIAPVYYVAIPQQGPYPPQYVSHPYGYFASIAEQNGLR